MLNSATKPKKGKNGNWHQPRFLISLVAMLSESFNRHFHKGLRDCGPGFLMIITHLTKNFPEPR